MIRLRPLISWFFLFMEEFRNISGFPNYQVSNYGNVKSFKGKEEKILIGGKNRGGYKCYNIRCKKNKTYFKTVHRLVALAFLDNANNDFIVNHKDGNKNNNHVDNLEWCNAYENNSHMRKQISRTSQYTGVYFDKSRGKWYATIKYNGKQNFLGRFINEEDAGNAYLKALETYNIRNKYAGNNSI